MDHLVQFLFIIKGRNIWVVQIKPKGFTGWRFAGEDERVDNISNRWAGWCEDGRED